MKKEMTHNNQPEKKKKDMPLFQARSNRSESITEEKG